MRLELERLLGDGLVTALAHLPSSDTVIAAVRNGLVLFSSSLQRKSAAESSHRDLITSIAVEPGESRIVSAGRDGLLREWTVGPKLKPGALIELGAPVNDLAWSPRGRNGRAQLAAALEDGSVALWERGARHYDVIGARGRPLRAVDWLPRPGALLVGGDDGALRLLSFYRGRAREQELFRHPSGIRRARVSPGGRYVAFTSGDERGAIYCFRTRKLTRFGVSGDPVVCLAWHPAKLVLAGGTERGKSFFYDLNSGGLRSCEAHLHPAEAVAWSAEGDQAWTGGRDGQVVAAALANSRWLPRAIYRPQVMGYALSCAWIPDSSRLAAGYSHGTVAVWEARKRAPPTLLEKPHRKPVYGLSVSPDGRAVASGSVDRTVKVWDLGEKLLAHELKSLHEQAVYGVSFSPDGRFVCTGSGDTFLVVYDIEQVKQAAREAFGPEEFWHFAVMNRILNCVAWSPDGQRIAVGLSSHGVVILAVDASGKVEKGPTLSLHEDSVSRVAWGPNASFLVSAGYDRRLAVWDPSSWSVRALRVVEHDEPIQALAVHPGGEVIATGSWDGTIRLWRADTLAPLGTYTRPHFSAVECLDFDPAGARLCSASSDGTVGLWRVIG
ncbi:MAG: hypothetical protein HYZ28_16090 [Myxococcales bacterium]|nr:hypothetical protein [Myxococcales bacterium]